MIKLIKEVNVQRKLEFIFFSSGHIDEIYKNNQTLFEKNGILITLLEEQINNEALLKFKDFSRLQIFSRDVNFSIPEMNYSEILKFYKALDYNHSIIFSYADEIIEIDQFESEDFNQFSLIAIKRYEGFFGKNTGLFSIQFRGGKIEAFLQYQSNYQNSLSKESGIHSFWSSKKPENVQYNTLCVLHNHKYDSTIEYGKAGRYTALEIDRLSKNKNVKWRFYRRYLFRPIYHLFNLKLFRTSKSFYIHKIRAQLIEYLLSKQILHERKLYDSSK